MPFWNDKSIEPKRSYRWVLNIGGIPHWICKKVDKPSFSVSETPHRYLNYTFYYPGKLEWNTLNITLVDPINPDASKTLMNVLEKSGYKVPQNGNEIQTFSKEKSVDAINPIVITQVGPDGEPIEEWSLYNPWVQQVNFGALDYDSEELVNIELTIRYDYANITKTAGQPVQGM